MKDHFNLYPHSVRIRDSVMEVVKAARDVADSPPRSAQSVRLISKLKEKIEELDKE